MFKRIPGRIDQDLDGCRRGILDSIVVTPPEYLRPRLRAEARRDRDRSLPAPYTQLPLRYVVRLFTHHSARRLRESPLV